MQETARAGGETTLGIDVDQDLLEEIGDHLDPLETTGSTIETIEGTEIESTDLATTGEIQEEGVTLAIETGIGEETTLETREGTETTPEVEMTQEIRREIMREAEVTQDQEIEMTAIKEEALKTERREETSGPRAEVLKDAQRDALREDR